MNDAIRPIGRCLVALTLILFAAPTLAQSGATSVAYEGKDGPGKGKHVVFLSGDEEYRSEEGLPMLAKILSQRHGFKCTVLFALDPDGTINPDNNKSLPGAEALDSADCIVMLLRWRQWPAEQMKHFADAYRRGVPIVALRTSTHPFKYDSGPLREFNGFGKKVVGEDWVSHWGRHKAEATRGVIEPSAKDHPVLRGVADVFGDSDVYEAYPPKDATILMRGQVLRGMNPSDPPADYLKTRATDKDEQGVNDPMMPVAWVRNHKNEAGKTNKVLTTTLGAATDLQSEGLRRLIVNGVYWALGLDVPQKADVTYVGEYKPTMYGFGGYKKGVKLDAHALPAGGGASKGKSSEAPLPDKLKLNKGDRVALIGNALPDRMQHDGTFETLVHAKFPDHELVFRNLAVAGDEVAIRHRSENFGSPDEWLRKVKADVILAFFGYNESFRGEAGLGRFKAELDRFLKETKGTNYSGRGHPRVVLFGPTANERHPDPNYPDPTENNKRLELYGDAMEEVARANGVQFVDLFEPTRHVIAAPERRTAPMTTNGHYLNDNGHRLLAPVMFQMLFGEQPPRGDFEKLRAAVNEKNAQWHQRYRTIDGYNVYGGRSKMEYEQGPGGPKLSNFKVMQEEMSQRDVLTANRDKRVWALARGRDAAVDDSNLPPVTPVKSNKPGPLPDGKHPFVSGEEAIKKMRLHEGLKINLFADEKQFPQLVNPVQMAWDTRGRLWVAAWPNYPERTPTSKAGDTLLVFEDTDGDGRADKCTPFLDDLNAPTGFQFYKDGVLLMQAPDLWFVRDTDGDGRGDWKERVLMGLDSADSHHTTNSMVLDPGGAVYLSDGVFHRTQVETQYGVVRNDDAAIYRYEPATGKFDTYIAYPFANPHGRAFDRWGNDFVTDATGNNTYFGPAFSGHIDYPQKHRNLRQFWERPSRPCPGTGILTSRHFPDDWQGNFLNLNVISFQGCYRVKVKEEGSGLWGESLPDLFYGEDPNFRPTFINVGPDGAVYFCDWHNPIIGHLQHHLRDPSRDDQHGRVYRITYNGRPLMKPVKIDGQPVEALLELLKEPENQTRELAKIELGEHDTATVIAAVKAWAAKLDKNDRNYEHHMMEALWVHQWHNVVDRALLDRMLKSPEPRARAAATRVLCYWRDRVPEVLSILRQQANDSDPRVRLHAVRAASFFRTAEAAEVALAALKHPTDYYLDYTMGETMRQLEPYWRRALEEGHAIARDNPAGLKYVVGGMSPEKLLELPRTPEVLEAIVMRRDVPETPRSVALDELATKRKTSRANVVLGMIDAVGRTDATAPALARLLPQQPASELAPLREQVGRFARGDTGPPEVRQAAWAAVAVADESFEKVWPEALKSPNGLQNLLRGIPLIYDPELRNKAYELVAPLITDPGETAAADEVRAGAIEAAASMNREQKATFSALVKLVQQGKHVAAATRGIRALPRTAWTASEAGAAAKALADWAEKVPADRRTSPDYVQAVQISADLAGMMPKEEAAALRQRLKGLRVAVFVVSTVREQMRYDTPRLVVEAGKPFEIILENGDFMPHNLVVVNGGTRDDVGNAAMKMRPDQLDDRGRPFVPRNRNVLGATKLLEPGQQETLKMTAPDREGEYEYVCTYPGHWEMMWGRLVVTKDVDKYLRDHPEAPAAGAGTSAGAGHNHH